MWEFAYEKLHLSSKIQLKTWPLTSSGISAQLFQKLQISCITEKKCIISTDILKVTFMILICFDLYNLFVCRKWPTKRKAKPGCVWECARVRKYKLWSLWSDRLLNNWCDCHSWLNLLIVSFTGIFLWAERKPRLIHITAVMSPFKNSSLSRVPLEQRSPISGPRCTSRLLPSSPWNTSHKLTIINAVLFLHVGQ